MKKLFIITFLVGGTILGIILTLQLKTHTPNSGNFPVDELEAREELIGDFINEQAYFQSRIVSLRKQIEDFQEEIQNQSRDYNIDLLNELKVGLGLSEVNGKGLEIYLDDSPYSKRGGIDISDKELIQAADIRDIVNALNAAHAEAISVNNQRIVSTSAISSVATNILVNNSHITPPLYIYAIGNKETLIRGLNNKNLLEGLYSRVSNSKIVYEVRVSDYIRIPIYNGNFKTEYLTLIE